MATFTRVFTLEVDGRPILTFEAGRVQEAQQLCKEPWLREDLSALSSNGIPLLSGNAKLTVRSANMEEATIFGQAASVANHADDMMLAYLVELDSPL